MAVGVAAVAVVSVVALYRPVLHAVTELDEEGRAGQVLRQVEAQARDLGPAATGTRIADGEVQFADRAGLIVAPADDAVWLATGATPAERDAAKQFEVRLHRHAVLSSASPGPLVVIAEVRWPAFRPDGARVTDPSRQRTRVAVFSVNR